MGMANQTYSDYFYYNQNAQITPFTSMYSPTDNPLQYSPSAYSVQSGQLNTSPFLENFTLCAGCSMPISDGYNVMKVMDKTWHSSCLKCSECNIQLSDKCFFRGGYLYCKNDFDRRYRVKCAGCNDEIQPTQIFRRVQDFVYHMHCFSCFICMRQLDTGDEFYLLENRKLICKSDYNNSRNRELELEVHQKRPRTTITGVQVDLLRTTYIQSSKPSRQIREQLANETGLDMRVVQVWFQNKRAKDKRLKKERNKISPYQKRDSINNNPNTKFHFKAPTLLPNQKLRDGSTADHEKFDTATSLPQINNESEIANHQTASPNSQTYFKSEDECYEQKYLSNQAWNCSKFENNLDSFSHDYYNYPSSF